MKRKFIISALGAMLLMCVCALGGCSGKRTINLADYVSVEYSGYSGDGAASVSINVDAMLPLVSDRISPQALEECFEAGGVKNNGKLSNGDTIGVAITYNELLLENAKIKVQNPALTFTVSGLKEKQKLDVFAGVEFSAEGISPECKLSVKYNGESPYGTLVMQLENGEIIENGFGERYFKNGEKVTLRVSEQALERLGKEYIVEEISREYIVQVDSSYILTAADLNDTDRKALDKIAEDYVNEKIQDIKDYNDKDARLRLFSNVMGANLGGLYAGGTTRVDALSVTEFNSAYVGVGTVSGSYGSSVKNQKSIYFFYDAEFSYYYKPTGIKVYEDTADCTLIVRIDDPKITPDGVMYSNITFASAKDYQTAYNSYITSEFEKLP